MSRTALTSRRYVATPEGDDAARLRVAAVRAATLREVVEAAELKKTKRVVEIDAPAKFDAGAGFMAGFGLGWFGGIVLLVMPGIHSLLGHTSPLIAGLYGAGVGSMIGMFVGGVVGSVRILATKPAQEKRPGKRYFAGRKNGSAWGAKSAGVSQASRLSEIRLGMTHESLQNSLQDFFSNGNSLPAPAHVKVPAEISVRMASHRAQSMPAMPLSLVLRPTASTTVPRGQAAMPASRVQSAKRAA